jgi:hypothetical protein
MMTFLNTDALFWSPGSLVFGSYGGMLSWVSGVPALYETAVAGATAWVLGFVALGCWSVYMLSTGDVAVLWPLLLLRTVGAFSCTLAFIPLIEVSRRVGRARAASAARKGGGLRVSM